MTTTAILTSFPYYRLTNSKVINLRYKTNVNASSRTVELWMHLADVLGGLVSSQELEV